MKNERLISLREKANLTQTQLGEAIGLTQGMICHLEARARTPSYAVIKRLTDYFNVSPEWLFFDREYCSKQ